MADDGGTIVPVNYLGVVDTLYRFGAGVDTNDTKLLETAFTVDAVVDFSPCGRKMGLDFPVLTGAETIVHFLGESANSQITSHIITNGRVHSTGDGAVLRALVDATPYLAERRFSKMPDEKLV